MKRLGVGAKDPFTVLGISPLASDDEVRAAWLEAARAHPPDRDPDQFQRVREAYELLRSAENRLKYRLFGRPGILTLTDLARHFEGPPLRMGFRLWRDVLRERS